MSNDLQYLVDAWEQSVRALSDVCHGLTEGQWNRATECPGWSIRDVVSHVIGVELELLGDPRPIHNLPSDLAHVRPGDEFSRYCEIPVDVRRCHTAAEMTGELSYVVGRRLRMLRDSDCRPETEVRGMMGRSTPYKHLLRSRAFDVWTHEQDVRRAMGRPGGLDSAAAQISRDFLLGQLPRVVAEDARIGAGHAVVFDVHGPLEFMRTVTVGPGGRASIGGQVPLAPLAVLATDWETFARLMCGRIRPAAADLKVEGDRQAADRILANIAVTL
ncbi:maleylpyruvate isomerase family mycothiol-dependent enzyme [Yinghuangia soli]|uniref:Maleylpyruvate isomerase family mycothiol-dependent enzyme n=1 Tax=Yinghuangia soli TaxID=2908204 RepID=A0AA41TYU3_9ACTN|nr:maleylpyruvate isomerase family mycothiol-dependent enzyme [Yinghuangia soli]MCF2526545.1 maleylpyruvate isomerase family mycothiol-dependent enzyme [Yinghuangia soli]